MRHNNVFDRHQVQNFQALARIGDSLLFRAAFTVFGPHQDVFQNRHRGKDPDQLKGSGNAAADMTKHNPKGFWQEYAWSRGPDKNARRDLKPGKTLCPIYWMHTSNLPGKCLLCRQALSGTR